MSNLSAQLIPFRQEGNLVTHPLESYKDILARAPQETENLWTYKDKNVTSQDGDGENGEGECLVKNNIFLRVVKMV